MGRETMNLIGMINENLISLEEVNSGMLSSNGFKKILDEIYNSITEKVKRFPNNKKFSELPTNLLDFSIFINYYKKNDLDFPVSETLEIFLKPTDNPPNESRKIIFPSAFAVTEEKPYKIIIGVNKEATKNEVLDRSDILSLQISHELTHVMKALYGEYQKTLPSIPKTLYGWKRYLSTPSEIEAFISQIGTELEKIKEADPTLTFNSALEKSKTYEIFFVNFSKVYKEKPHVVSKLRKYMISKLFNYWNTDFKK
jgi:hypothetical protein